MCWRRCLLAKAYWFYLEPFVFSIVKGKNQVALYNTHSGDFLEYSDAPDIIRLVKRLAARENLYVVPLSESMLAKPEINAFIKKVRERFMGDLLDQRHFPHRPVQMMPFLNIEKDAEKFKKDAPERVGEDLMTYVSEISLYLTNRCLINCTECHGAYRQFLHCTRIPDKRVVHLPLDAVENIFKESTGTSLCRFNLLGGDILEYPHLEELIPRLQDIKPLKSVYFHYKSISNNHEQLRAVRLPKDSSEINVLVHFPIDQRRLRLCQEYLNPLGLETTFFFPVKNELEFETAMEADIGARGSNKRLLPFYDGTNLEFFEKNVFLTREIILEAKPSLQDIFSRQAINGNNFGKLIVFPDGGIYSNVNFPALGNINRISLYDAVYKEMLQGKGWRLSRRRVKPCSRCVFEALCPPLSNYELAIGRNNLCDIWRG